MLKTLLALTLAAVCLISCTKASTPSAIVSSSTTRNDTVQQKLQELAGGSATDCGRHDVQAKDAELTAASNCATEAAKNKKAFYVGYDMPGMTTAVAGNAEGKLFAVELQGSGTGAQLSSGPCPAELRVAKSGRLTCFVPGSMGLGPAGADPHSGMSVKPPAGGNPHDSLGIPQPMAPPPQQPTTPSPQQTSNERSPGRRR